MIFTLMALLAGALSGCAVLAPGTGFGGGTATLADAEHAAKADSTDKVKRLDAGNSSPAAVEIGASADVDNLADAPEPDALDGAPKPQRVHSRPLFGVVGGLGALGGAEYDRLATFGLTGGNFETGRFRWNIAALATETKFTGESREGKAFQDAMDLELNASARWFLTPDNTLMGAYGIVGVGTGTLLWSYAQPVPVVHDGAATTVSDDWLNHFDAFAGAGVSLLQTRHLHLGTNAVGGVRFYGWHTHQGFANDELPTTGFLRMLIELEFR